MDESLVKEWILSQTGRATNAAEETLFDNCCKRMEGAMA
jgi:hypothetical protein